MKTIGSIIISIILAFAQSTQALIPRATFSKPDKVTIRDCDRWDLLVVKFNEKTGIRLRDGIFISMNSVDLTELEALLKNYPVTKIARLFQRPENIYEMEKVIGETRSGRDLADLNLYYAFGPKTRFEAEILLEDLNNLDIVECAYAEPIPELPVNPVPDILNPPSYVGSQEYLDSSPIGVDAYAA
ncbi:hypothetical protein K8T06_04050 [bacterium]|nr:hypothetical protein [bacterium]